MPDLFRRLGLSFVAALAIACLALLPAACGGEDDDGADPTVDLSGGTKTATGEKQRCEGGEAQGLDCPAGNCDQMCAGGGDCTFACAGGGCSQGCAGGGKCTFTCSGGGCWSDNASGSFCK